MLGFLLDWERACAAAGQFPPAAAALRWARGLTFVALWYTSICAGMLFLYCPLLPLLLLHQRLFRTLTDIVFASWEIYPAALLECLLGIRIIVTGDPILSSEHSLLVMNHRTRTDWNFLWAGMFHASQPLAHRLKFVLKDPIRHIPGPGWVMQLGCFLFIHRNWEKDKHLLAKVLDYFSDIKHTCQILLFPEGTDLTESSRKRSHQFATTHGLKHYNYVLHPKTTGFVFLVQRMRENNQLDAVYDLTVGYPFHVPQQETDLLKGKFPQEVHFHVKRFPGSILPDEESELRSWLSNLWCEKEQTLHNFYSSGRFKESLTLSSSPKDNTSTPPDAQHTPNLNSKPSAQGILPSPDYSQLSPNSVPPAPGFAPSDTNASSKLPFHSPHSSALYLSLLFWTLLSFLLGFGLLMSTIVQLWVLTNCLLFIGLSVFSEGTHLIEISLYSLKRRYFERK